MEYKYRFAGIDILVQIPDEAKYVDDYRLGKFRVENVVDPHVFKIEMVEKLAEPMGDCLINKGSSRTYEYENQRIRYIGSVENTLDGAYIRVENFGKNNFVQLKKASFSNYFGAKTILNSLDTEHMVAQAGGFILHCSYIERAGKAILFTAPSGTGKSTQAELWKQYRDADIINGDRAAVRLIDGVIYAEGIPFSGSSKHCKNRTLPVEAIVYLSQASESKIRKLQGYKAFSKIWEGASVNSWDKTDLESISYVIQETAKKIPVYYLECAPDESAIIALENVLRKGASL